MSTSQPIYRTVLSKNAGFSFVFGAALLLAACNQSSVTKSAVAEPTQTPQAAAAPVNASKTTTETKPAEQSKPVTASESLSETKTADAASAATEAKPLVMLHEDAKLGKILVDAKGMTLYLFDKDTADKSNCTGDCVTKWPLLTVADEKEALIAGEGVTAKMGVIRRDDGKYQVTANGMPLYYFANDKAAGDVTGQGAGEVWWVLGADGSKISTK